MDAGSPAGRLCKRRAPDSCVPAAAPRLVGGAATERRSGYIGGEQFLAVIGAGVGGLATALALQKAGIRARVYERDTGFAVRRQGYGMTMSTTNSALSELGLLEELRRRDVASQSHYTFASDGAILGYFGNALRDEPPPPERGNLRVPRQTLRQMLLDRLQPDTVVWGEQLASFTEEPNALSPEGGVTLCFSSGLTVSAAALVGADGVRSVVRQQRQPPAPPLRYLGVLIVVGIVPSDHPLVVGRGFYTVDGTIRLFTMPYTLAEGEEKATTMWQMSIAMPEVEARALCERGAAACLTLLRGRCASWHEPVPTLLRDTAAERVWAAPLSDAQPPAAPTKGSKSVRAAALPLVATLSGAVSLLCYAYCRDMPNG